MAGFRREGHIYVVTVQQPIATIRVWLYHMGIRVRYVPYAYGIEYTCGIQQLHYKALQKLSTKNTFHK